MEKQSILKTIKAAGATTTEEIKAVLEDGEALKKLGITDQAAVEELWDTMRKTEEV